MITHTIGGKPYQVPQTWNELTGEQLVAIMQLFATGMDPVELLFRLLQVVTAIPRWRFVRIPTDDLVDHLHLVDFLLKENTLTKNLLPSTGGMHGPADSFNNLVMCEFVFSEDYFMRWKANEADAVALNNLVAVLYRPGKSRWAYSYKKNPDGDVRVPFNENECHHLAGAVISRWPLAKKLAVAHWYDACRAQITKDFPTVFGGGGEASRWGLISTMRNVAQNGVHGDFKQVEQMHVRLVLIELDEMLAEAEKIENSFKK